MIYLYQSNRLEYLAEIMAKIQLLQPLPDALSKEEIIVQSQGMRRFITRFLAKENGIAANLNFRLPAGLSWKLTQTFLPNIPALSPFSPEVMQWRLLNLFRSDAFTHDERFELARQVLMPYLADGERAMYLLAGQLADTFDQYLVYRPDWIESWQQGKWVAGLDESQKWQMTLWQALDDGQSRSPHRMAMWKQLMQALNQDSAAQLLPKRYFVFGISSLAPMYLDLLMRLGHHCDVFIFALNPSSLYWGDILDTTHLLNHADDVDLSQQGHPLLASLGKQGRDFFNALNNVETIEHAIYDEETSPSLLHSLQNQIQNQIPPKHAAKENWLADHQSWLKNEVFPLHPNRAAWFEREQEQALNNQLNPMQTTQSQAKFNEKIALAQLNADTSIQIHAAHSALRELQILKDQIGAALSENPDWQPHDIAVLTPHIEPYAPFIDAVFGETAADGYVLPYSIADVKLSRRQPLLDAIEQVFHLINSRFEADKILNFLEQPNLLAHFGLHRDQLALIRQTISDLNIRWGFDANERKQYGATDNDNLFTWQQGLDRIKLGWFLPETSTLWQGLSAWHSHPDHMDTLARFADILHHLERIRNLWHEEATPEVWCERTHDLIHSLFTLTDDDQLALRQFNQALTRWQEEWHLAQSLSSTLHYSHAIHGTTAIQHLQHFLHSQSETGFLRSGITFCSMVPMRSLPFKMICLLGLNDKEFPRDTQSNPFDLITHHPRSGDRSRRDDDRYLFLEALLSARERLHLSYVGRDIRTNSELNPSSLIYELVDTVAQLLHSSTKAVFQSWIITHPLQNFSERYFQNMPRLWSGRHDIAHALNQVSTVSRPFYASKLPEKAPISEISQEMLITFWHNPTHQWLKNYLLWNKPFIENSWSSEESFQPEPVNTIHRHYLHDLCKGVNLNHTQQTLYAQNLLPSGQLGQILHQQYASQATSLPSELLHSPALPERSGVFIPHHRHAPRLNYRLNHLYQQGQIFFDAHFLSRSQLAKNFSASHKLSLLLHHLIYCATSEENEEKSSYYIDLNQVIQLPPIPKQQAQEVLSDWLDGYQQGQNQPIAYLNRTALAASAALLNKKNPDTPNWQEAEKKAEKSYFSGEHPEKDKAEIKLIYGHLENDTPVYQTESFQYWVNKLLLPLHSCIIAMPNS